MVPKYEISNKTAQYYIYITLLAINPVLSLHLCSKYDTKLLQDVIEAKQS